LDEVIAICRASPNRGEAKDRLQNMAVAAAVLDRALGTDAFTALQRDLGKLESYRMTEAQAEAVVRLQLGQLAALERDEILKEYGDRVTFIYKDYPLVEIHPWATHAAVDANCLATQNSDAYWDFADYVHANQREVSNEKTPAARTEALDRLTMLQGQKHNLDLVKLQSCIKAQDETAVKASMKEAEGIGVEATPTLFINGQKIDGAVPIGDVRAALDQALKDANLPVPEHAAVAAAPTSK